jgi:hypothetical protein
MEKRRSVRRSTLSGIEETESWKWGLKEEDAARKRWEEIKGGKHPVTKEATKHEWKKPMRVEPLNGRRPSTSVTVRCQVAP